MLIPWEGICFMIKAIYKITNKINNKEKQIQPVETILANRSTFIIDT